MRRGLGAQTLSRRPRRPRGGRRAAGRARPRRRALPPPPPAPRCTVPRAAPGRGGGRSRHPRLLADALYAELRRAEPELEGELHRRAADWHRAAGDLDRTLAHMLAAGDLAAAGALVTAQAGDCIANGREDTLERRLHSFSEAQVTADPGLCLAAAGHHLTRGEGHLAEHWAMLAGEGVPRGVPGVLRAALGRDGIARIGEDAATASAQLGERSPWRAVCSLLGGVAAH